MIDGAHPLFIKAQNYFEKGDYINSAKLYKSYLKINPDSVRSNYQLGTIYQDKKEYIQAIFHYEKYLALASDSSDKKIIQKWINSSKEQLFKELEQKYTSSKKATLADKITDSSQDNDNKLIEKLKRLEIKNEKMRDLILRHKDAIYSKNNNTKKNDSDHKAITAKKKQERFYTIKSGDTLYGISKKAYGTSKFYKFIYEKNKLQLNLPTNLIPGTQIIIPSKPTH